jgi:hypothetical protein
VNLADSSLIPRPTVATLVVGTRGAIFVEYVTILVVLSLGLCAATAALGVPLLRLYRYAQTMLMVPFP